MDTTAATTPPTMRPGGAYPESVTRLIEELSRLPGIGRRSAERLAFHVLKAPNHEAMALSAAIADVKQKVSHCAVCYNLTDRPPGEAGGGQAGVAGGLSLCAICAAAKAAAEGGGAVGGAGGVGGVGVGGGGRDASCIMVVEQPKDLIALEQTGTYKGVYHVLMGRISPLDGVTAGDLTVAALVARVHDRSGAANLGVPVAEVVLALNPTLEGDGTGLYLARELARRGVKVTRLARGLPTGSQLEFANKAVLADAITGRRPMERDAG
jgi:recombination protein RecR